MMHNRRDGPIHEAVRNNNIKRIHEILQSDPSCVNDYNLDLKTPLQLVYDHVDFVNPVQSNDRLPTMQLLIDYGAIVNLKSSQDSALHAAARRKQTDVVKFLLKHAASPNAGSLNFYTALDIAAQISCEPVVELLLHHRADPNIFNSWNRNSVDIAIQYSSLNIVRLLVAFGAKSKNIYKRLFKACTEMSHHPSQDKREKIKFLLSNAFCLDSHQHYSPKTLMYYIFLKQHHMDEEKCYLIELLNNRGINIHDNTGDSYLHMTVRNGRIRETLLLIRNGSNVNVKNLFGDTPLHVLFKTYHSDWMDDQSQIAKILIDKGADLRAHNFLDETPFYIAVKKRIQVNYPSLMCLMLSKIARVPVGLIFLPRGIMAKKPRLNIGYNENELKLHELITAISYRSEYLVDLLLDVDYVALVGDNYCCEDVNTALSTAVENGLWKTLKMLLEAGFRTNSHFLSDYVLLKRFCTKNDLQVACLLVEFQDDMIHGIMNENFSKFVEDDNESDFIKLITFYYAMFLRSKNLSKDLIPLQGLFKLDAGLTQILSVCNKILDKLNEVKVSGNDSIFDIITMRLDSLVRLLKNKDYFDSCSSILSSLKCRKNLDFYNHVVKTRIDLAIEKRKVINRATYHLTVIFQGILFHDIIKIIIAYLNMRELKKLAKLETGIL